VDDLIEVWFEGTIKLRREDIQSADGEFTQAVQNELGSSGAVIESAQDENDCYTLEQHDQDEERQG
jgi:hypothetical protein